jgi:plasmid maintenance system antidote protein VapI
MNLFKKVKEHNSIIDTYKEEAVYIGRCVGISYRKLAKETGVSLATQVRLNKYYDEHPNMYVGITKHLDQAQYEEVYKFMKIIDIVKEL